MDEKKVTKISLSTIFLILAILVIVGMGIFIYKINNDKLNEIQKSEELQKQVTSLNSTVSDLQGKIDSISNTINSGNEKTNNVENNENTENTVVNNNNVQKNNDNEKITEYDKNYIKNVIETYYKLLSKKEEEPASMLMELGLELKSVQDPNYSKPEGYIEHPSGKYMWTGIKYKDFKNAMENYISENILKSKFTEFVEYKDYLYIEEHMNDSSAYEITSMKLQSYEEKKCVIEVELNKESKKVRETITLTRGNGDFIISNIK